MVNSSFEIVFIEADTVPKERLLIHKPHAGELEPVHPYYQKRMIWTLIKRDERAAYPYDAIEEDQRKGIRYQEIPIVITDDIIGINAQSIQQKLNNCNCFAFEYVPTEFDNLRLRSDYVYDEIKSMPRMHSRAIELISFTFINGQWCIDTTVELGAFQKGRQGFVDLNQTYNIGIANSGA
jgi:hypothetical protein